jgi:hypothetical protein
MHPKKSLIFQGTRFIPLPLDKGKGEDNFFKGAKPLLSLSKPSLIPLYNREMYSLPEEVVI